MIIQLAASWTNIMCNTHDLLQHKAIPSQNPKNSYLMTGILITRVLSLKPLYVHNISCSHISEVSAKQQCSSTVFVVFMNGCFLFLVAAFLVVLYDINKFYSRLF